MFGMNQPQANFWIHLLKSILLKTRSTIAEKKTHTVKNILITSVIKKVLYLSPTYEGKAHDKSICDEEQIRFEVPVTVWEDLGFIGLNPDNTDVRRPIRKN